LGYIIIKKKKQGEFNMLKSLLKSLFWLVVYVVGFSVVGHFFGGNGVLIVIAILFCGICGEDWIRHIKRKRAFQKKGSKTTRK